MNTEPGAALWGQEGPQGSGAGSPRGQDTCLIYPFMPNTWQMVAAQEIFPKRIDQDLKATTTKWR